jgi:hypothetical protein
VESHHRRFLLLEQGIGSAIFNVLLNGAIAWALFRHLDVIPLWGQESIVGDTLGTTFFLPFFTTLIVTPLVRRRVKRGSDLPAQVDARLALGARLATAGNLPARLTLGFVTLIVVGPLAVLALHGLPGGAARLRTVHRVEGRVRRPAGAGGDAGDLIWALAEPA